MLTKIQKIKSNITNEGEQAIIRVVFLSFILAYLAIVGAGKAGISACSLYLSYSIIYAFFVIAKNAYNPLRQYYGLFVDVGMASYGMGIIGAQGGIFIGLYLWLIIGYGLRYGVNYTKVAYVLSICGYMIATTFNAYWNEHIAIVHGFLVTLCLIPIHTLRLQKKLEDQTQKAKQASEAKSNFLSHMSHEIRTPINGIVGTVELLSNTKLNATQVQHVTHLKNASDMLRDIVNNILDISKIEQNKLELCLRPTSVQHVIDNTTSLFEPQCIQKGLSFNVIFHGKEDIQVLADELHLREVLNNLLSNAIKFTHAGHVTLTINKLFDDDEQVQLRFSVSDSGIGIPESKIQTIFDTFEQADATIATTYGGSGLGTTIAKSLVELMGGEINLISKEGEGSQFFFTLTFKKVVDHDVLNVPHNVISIDKYRQTNKKINVLIADDSNTNRYILKTILESNYFNVLEASNGNECLDIIEQNNHIDLMLLDFNMPDMTGLEVIAAHRGLSYDNLIPCAIVTADATKKMQLLCEEHKVNHLLLKPYVTNDVLNLVNQLIDLNNNVVHTNHVNEMADNAIANNLYINQAQIEQLRKLNQNPVFIATLISEFVGDFEIALTKLKKLIKSKDYSACRNIAHAISGNAGNLGFIHLYNECSVLENIDTFTNAKWENQLINIENSFATTKNELNQLIDFSVLHKAKSSI